MIKEKLENSHNPFEKSKPGQFGNLQSYYSRKKTDIWSDERLENLPKDIFAGKRVLYIGCHEGYVPIQIALNFQPQEIVAIDIDFKLLKKAVLNSWLIDGVRDLKEKNINAYDFELTSLKNHALYQGYLKTQTSEKNDRKLSEIIDFQLQNFINLDQTFKYKKFDVICCFKVTKYVHLNFGDEGIDAMFNNFENLLNDNGVLLLQSQSKKSYQKNKSFCPTFRQNYEKITRWPENFNEILIKEYGFELLSKSEKKEDGKKKKHNAEKKNKNKVWMFKLK